MLACLPVWVSPHMWHTVGKGLKVCLSFSLSLSALFLFLQHFHPIPQTVLWWQLTPVRLRFACGIIFVREAAFDCCAGTLFHTMAPLFWSPQVFKVDPEPWGCRGVGQMGGVQCWKVRIHLWSTLLSPHSHPLKITVPLVCDHGPLPPSAPAVHNPTSDFK